MQEITNPKIEKQKGEIEKTKGKIAELQAKQREQEKQLRALEDLEIVARFRSERVSDAQLGAAKRSDWDEFPETKHEEVKNSETDTEI
jgi:hypothetical protein